MQPDAAGISRRTRCDVDDASPLLRAHVRQDGLRAQKCRFQVDGNGLVEIRFGQIVDAAANGDTGIVDQDVDRAKLTIDIRDHRGDGRRLADVGLDDDRAPPQRRDIAATRCASSTRERQLMATSQPASARASAMARPMPRDAPVTRQMRPLKFGALTTTSSRHRHRPSFR
jgi:hypothetical protein